MLEQTIVMSLQWFRELARDYWPRVLALLGAVLIPTAELFFQNDPTGPWVFWPGVLFLLVGEIVELKHKKRISSLEKTMNEQKEEINDNRDVIEQARQDYAELLRTKLRTLSERLELEDSERVSLYKHDGEAFVLLGRYSEDPVYSQNGRPYYSEDEGCINEAWRNGQVHIDDLPDPSSDFNDWLEKQKIKCNVKKQDARQFTMHSRSYLGFAIRDASEDRRAVLMFESTHARAFDKENVRLALTDGEEKMLGRFLESMRSIEPTPSYAREEGF